MNKKTVCVVGLGYIGLPTAALLASNGYQVVGVDLNTHAVETINQGRIHIVEPDLDAFVRSAVSAGRLKAFTTPQAGDVYMICVPTPFHEGGVGGHCIAVDPWFIVARDVENARLIRTAREVNNYKTVWAIDQIKIAVADASARTGRKPKVACLGLAFKPDIDDLRESPALHIAEALLAQGYDVVAVEPNIDSHEHFTLLTLEEVLKSADVFAVLVKHRGFLDEPVKMALSERSALDFCGVLA